MFNFKLTSAQISRLSNIMDNAGQVVLATMVLNPLLAGGLDKTNRLVIISGSVGTIFLWVISIILAKEGGEKRD